MVSKRQLEKQCRAPAVMRRRLTQLERNPGVFLQDPAVLVVNHSFPLSPCAARCMGAVAQEVACILTRGHTSYGFTSELVGSLLEASEHPAELSRMRLDGKGAPQESS